MKRNNRLFTIILIFLFLIVVTGCTKFSENQVDKEVDDIVKDEVDKIEDIIILAQSSNESIELIATSFIADILNKEFKTAYESFEFSDEMKEAIDEAALGQILIATKVQYGDYVGDLDNYIIASGDYRAVYVQLEFEKDKMAFQVSFDTEDKIAGVFFQEYKVVNETMTKEDKEAEEIEVEGSVYEEVSFGLEDYILPATISTTKTSDLIVVMVHGSGPNDRDVTVGPNKIFKDIEQGLLKEDFGSFRYDKRTLVYGEEIASDVTFGLYDETVEDAVLAVEKIREEYGEEIKIVVLGHSQGGHAIPYIAKELSNKGLELDGYIIMAGNYSPIYELIEMQLEFLSKLDDEYDAGEKNEVDRIVQGFEDLKAGKLEPEDPLFYVNAAYWQSFLDYDIDEDINYIDKPTLVLNGSRDYQVPPSEVALWEEVLDGELSSFHIIEGVNHLMIEGFGDPSPNEYYEVGHVDVEVIDLITNFLSDL